MYALRVCVSRSESEVTEDLCSELEVSLLLKYVPKFESEGIHGVSSLTSVKV